VGGMAVDRRPGESHLPHAQPLQGRRVGDAAWRGAPSLPLSLPSSLPLLIAIHLDIMP
jgi:hypothetical protein